MVSSTDNIRFVENSTFQVLVLSFNHMEITRKCLLSVQKWVPDSNIILIHNGSEDLVRQQLHFEFPHIGHIFLEKNQGYSGGANFGLNFVFENKKNPSEWVLFLTNDTQLKKLEKPPQQPGLYAPKILKRNTDKIDSLGGSLNLLNGKLRHLRVYNQNLYFKSNIYSRYYVPGTAFWLHRETFKEGGGFDTTLHTYWEDVDLSIRYENLGLCLGRHLDTVLSHAIGRTCHKKPIYTKFYFHRNRKIIWKRYAPWWLKPFLKINFNSEKSTSRTSSN